MGNWSRFARRVRRRDLLVWLALSSHLAVAFGFPLPAPGRTKPTDGAAYPCQSFPCGCLSSEQCWAGDCCCFTLEQKVAWAEANGVEPPPHVRPLVASRQARPSAPPKKKKSCCAETAPEPAPVPPPTCCGDRPPAAAGCRDAAPPRSGTPAADRALDAATSEPDAREESAPAAGPGVRWAAGVFAQKCRGEGPAGLLQPDPTPAPDVAPAVPPAPARDAHPRPRSERPTSLTHRPPARPPRSR